MSTFTPVVPTSPPQSNSAQTPAALSLEARFRASQYNRSDAIYDLASRLNVSDTSKLNVDTIPERYAGTSGPARSFARANDPAISNLDVDSIPVQSQIAGRFFPTVPVDQTKLDRSEFSGTKPAPYAGTSGPARSFARAKNPALSKLDIDSIPAQFNVNSRLSGLPSQASKLNIDSIPARFNVSSRLSGLPSQASKLDRDGTPSRYAP